MLDSFPSSGLSLRSEAQICALCATPARYKCPRCATPTCSLPCSRKHKENTRCTGERDKAQYVSMNAYDWATMMRDYCYLEEVGRKVSECGREIVRGGYTENVSKNKVASTRQSSRGRKSSAGKSKREMLRAHLETLGIDVELLPAGMERRNQNRSAFDQKSKCSLLTIEFEFNPPATIAFASPPLSSSYNMLSHRNSLSATLLSILQRQVSFAPSKSQKQKENTPDWLSSLVSPHPEAPECFVPPHCYMRANTEFLRAPNTTYYHKLEPTLSLGELLQSTSFVEFPTIRVFDSEASSFCGTVIDKSGSIVRVLEDDQVSIAMAVRRRKLRKTVGLNAVFSLVGGYGSEGSSRSEEETATKRLTGLTPLEAYSRDDDDVASINVEVEEDQPLDSDIDVSAEDNQLDPARLSEYLKQVRNAAEEDMLDWEDEWDTNAEEQC